MESLIIHGAIEWKKLSDSSNNCSQGFCLMISFNTLLAAYLGIYLTSSIIDLAVDKLNAVHLKKYGAIVPDAFKGIIDDTELKEISKYTVENTRFAMIQKIAGKIIFILIILSGLLPWLGGTLRHLNAVFAGLIFFAALGIIAMIVGLPFDLYHTFIIEEKFGFNTRTLKIWLTDLLKSLLVTAILAGALLSALLLVIQYTGQTWWVWAWVVFFGFQLLMIVLYPTVIAPLFNKFTPIENLELKGKIADLARKEGLRIDGIYQMDATKRTRHTNAYFTGLGKAKRVVLFDSLIAAHSHEEILAILAHEIGHLKKNHIKKHLVVTGIASLLLLFLASKLLAWDVMYKSFGFAGASDYVGLFLVGVLWEPVGFFLSPVGMAISRWFEREADFYAIQTLNTAKDLSMALKKMARENLSNLRPHPYYVYLNYSHPPMLKRIESIETAPIA